jgi:hypothetical protein
MSLLDFIIEFIPVANVPELIIENLIGDDCLDDETIKSVFQRPYKNERGYTYLDREMTVLHSFHDKPAVTRAYAFCDCSQEWYHNGRRHRSPGPAISMVVTEHQSLITNIFINHGHVTKVTLDGIVCQFSRSSNLLKVNTPAGNDYIFI